MNERKARQRCRAFFDDAFVSGRQPLEDDEIAVVNVTIATLFVIALPDTRSGQKYSAFAGHCALIRRAVMLAGR